MNDQIGLERSVRAHLEASAPAFAPNRLRTEILSTTEVMRPRPRLFAGRGLPWRIRPMFKLSATAAVFLIAGLAVAPMLTALEQPSATSPTLPPASELPALPPELMKDWVAMPPTSTDWGVEYPAHSLLWLREHTADLVGGYDGDLTSAAGVAPDGALVIDNATPIAYCSQPSVGSYDWELSDGGQWLTLTARGDDCAARRGFLGRTWLRTQAIDGSAALGAVEPGDYWSVFLTPRAALGDDWTNDPGELTYTVPAGWAVSVDKAAEFTLTPEDQYSTLWNQDATEASVWPSGITVYARPAPIVASDPCSEAIDPSIERTPEALAAYLATRPELTVSAPETVDVGGRHGVSVDVAIADGSAGSCPEAADVPIVPLFAEDTAEPQYGVGIGGQAQAVAGSDPQRLIFLDIGEGDVVMVKIDSITEAGFDDFVATATPVVESFRFTDP